MDYVIPGLPSSPDTFLSFLFQLKGGAGLVIA